MRFVRATSRPLPCPSELVLTLKKWRLQCPKGALDPVFPTTDGLPQHRSQTLDNVLRPALAAAALAEHFHFKEQYPFSPNCSDHPHVADVGADRALATRAADLVARRPAPLRTQPVVRACSRRSIWLRRWSAGGPRASPMTDCHCSVGRWRSGHRRRRTRGSVLPRDGNDASGGTSARWRSMARTRRCRSAVSVLRIFFRSSSVRRSAFGPIRFSNATACARALSTPRRHAGVPFFEVPLLICTPVQEPRDREGART